MPISRNPRVPFHRIIAGWFLCSPTLYKTSSMGSWTSQDISRVPHCRGIQFHCPGKPRDVSQTCPECPTTDGPLSIPFRSPRKPRDIPNMSRVSYSRWLQSHCPSHPRVRRSSGTSQTCPKCPTLDGSNPTVYLFQSPRKPRNILDMS